MRPIASFLRNKDGVAAVEFAMVVGPLLVLLLGGVEIAGILSVDRKTTSAAAAVADLVAQAGTITNNDRDNIFAAATALMAPYDPAQLQVVVSSIVYTNSKPTVAWSDSTPGVSARAVGSNVPIGNNDGQIPDGLIDATTSVIMAEVKYHYVDATSSLLTGPHDMGAMAFNRPRRVIAVARTP
jgi:Flp pilus assembly protein TadG